MKSKAQFKSHPLHPMLIPFPIAFLVGAFVADAVGFVAADPTSALIAHYLMIAGIVTALIAAVPGFIDYVTVVPPESSGKTRATRHMIVNLVAVGIFVVVFILRGSPGEVVGVGLVLAQLVALGFLGSGGWMGGTLVYRNQIGVDHRYAGAGKWQEAQVEKKDGRVMVGRTGDLEVNQMKLVHMDGQRMVLGRSESGYVLFEDRCTHRGASLADGSMICGTVQCPWHGSQFDVRSGAVKAGPADQPIRTFTVEEHDGDLIATVSS